MGGTSLRTNQRSEVRRVVATSSVAFSIKDFFLVIETTLEAGWWAS